MKPRPIPALKAPFNTSPPLEGAHVKSSNIKDVAYDADQHLLQITFHSGHTYDYLGVPPNVHEGLMTAKSKGEYLHQAIAPRFRSVKRAQGPH